MICCVSESFEGEDEEEDEGKGTEEEWDTELDDADITELEPSDLLTIDIDPFIFDLRKSTIAVWRFSSATSINDLPFYYQKEKQFNQGFTNGWSEKI